MCSKRWPGSCFRLEPGELPRRWRRRPEACRWEILLDLPFLLVLGSAHARSPLVTTLSSAESPDWPPGLIAGSGCSSRLRSRLMACRSLLIQAGERLVAVIEAASGLEDLLQGVVACYSSLPAGAQRPGSPSPGAVRGWKDGTPWSSVERGASVPLWGGGSRCLVPRFSPWWGRDQGQSGRSRRC